MENVPMSHGAMYVSEVTGEPWVCCVELGKIKARRMFFRNRTDEKLSDK